MGNDSLPPGITRGPYRGRPQPKATLLWIAPALTALLWARMTVARWIQYGDGWTLMFLGILIANVMLVFAAVRENRRRRRSTEPHAAR